MIMPSPAGVASLLEELFEQGWCIVPDALPGDIIAALDADLAPSFAQTPFCQGAFYGETTKRFGRILNRSSHASALVQHPLILEIAEHVLGRWCDSIQLNVGQAIAVHLSTPVEDSPEVPL